MAETEAPILAAGAPLAEAPPVAEKPAKEKKAKVPKEKKPKEAKSAPSHPPYFQMIKEAIVSLHEKNGSSAYAIAKHMESKHKDVLPANYKKKLTLQLKSAATKGKLVKVKASFKLAEVPNKKVLSAPAKKHSNPAKPKAASKKAPSKPVKKPAVKKTPKRKAATPKPKMPKSIKSAKSPVAKKARRAA